MSDTKFTVIIKLFELVICMIISLLAVTMSAYQDNPEKMDQQADSLCDTAMEANEIIQIWK